jgi:hypothetical protein
MYYKNVEVSNISSWWNTLRLIVFFVLPPMLVFFLYPNKLLALIIPVSIVLLFIVLTLLENKRFEKTYEWKEVDAKIQGKKLRRYYCNSSYRTFGPPWSRFRKENYKLDTEYSYIIDGKEYISNQYALAYYGDNDCNYLYSLSDALELMHTFDQKDKIIKVYVNPDNPEESVIKRGRSKWYKIPFSYFVEVFGMIIMVAIKIW